MARRQNNHGHHGGAWKVAYADFVTAMMALFMVLWICSQSEEIVEATASYFQNPMGAFSPIDSKKVIESGDSEGNAQDKKNKPQEGDNNIEFDYLKSLASQFYQKLNLDPTDEDKPIDVIVTNDGLRIIAYDRSKQPLFIPKTAILTDWGVFIMQNLAWIIERYPMKVKIEGHLSTGLNIEGEYNQWDLTSNRANVTRKNLVEYALNPKKIICVSGYGCTQVLPEVSPDSEKNQRIELSLILSNYKKTKNT